MLRQALRSMRSQRIAVRVVVWGCLASCGGGSTSDSGIDAGSPELRFFDGSVPPAGELLRFRAPLSRVTDMAATTTQGRASFAFVRHAVDLTTSDGGDSYYETYTTSWLSDGGYRELRLVENHLTYQSSEQTIFSLGAAAGNRDRAVYLSQSADESRFRHWTRLISGYEGAPAARLYSCDRSGLQTPEAQGAFAADGTGPWIMRHHGGQCLYDQGEPCRLNLQLLKAAGDGGSEVPVCPFADTAKYGTVDELSTPPQQMRLHPSRRLGSFGRIVFFSFDASGGITDFLALGDSDPAIRSTAGSFWPSDDDPPRKLLRVQRAVGATPSGEPLFADEIREFSWVDGGVAERRSPLSEHVLPRFYFSTGRGVVVIGDVPCPPRPLDDDSCAAKPRLALVRGDSVLHVFDPPVLAPTVTGQVVEHEGELYLIGGRGRWNEQEQLMALDAYIVRLPF